MSFAYWNYETDYHVPGLSTQWTRKTQKDLVNPNLLAYKKKLCWSVETQAANKQTNLSLKQPCSAFSSKIFAK